MKSATSEECCRAFLEWTSRYGVPHAAVSDNGNSFVANLYKDIMKTFNVQVKFTPAYHAATNGAIEKRHQTIKNSLKASLIDMGNEHGDRWMDAPPWVMLGKRIAVQPDLDISAAQLVFAKSLSIPGQLLGHPGAPLSNLQTKALLEQLYKMSAKPPVPTSTVSNPIDLTHTEGARHVYVKVEDPAPLAPRFEGPYEIVDRPSRSTVTVRIGSFANGDPRLQTYNWNTLKIAHVREGATLGSRPALGRKPNPPKPPPPTTSSEVPEPTDAETPAASNQTKQTKRKRPRGRKKKGAKIQTDKPPNPNGPLITRDMFDKWTPDLLGLPPSRPARSTRNANPRYAE